MKILLIEDDPHTAVALSEALMTEKYLVDRADNGKMGLQLAEVLEYDLILLDVMLPQLDGITVCRRLRDRHNQTPILLLTAKDRPKDCVIGLEAGADDYLAKPFDWSELLARIHALLRRGQTLSSHLLTWENLQLDLNAHEVSYNGEILHLTPKEYGLLELFLRNPQRIFSRQAILDRLWQLDKMPGEETVTAHMKGLRQKLKAVGMTQEMIETVYGFGYRLQAENSENAPANDNLLNESPSFSVAEQQVQAKIAQIWETVKQDLGQEVEKLVQFIHCAPKNRKNLPNSPDAIAVAHRLAGTLGIFGQSQESAILRQIEELLLNQTDNQEDIARQLLNLATALERSFEQDKEKLAFSASNEDNLFLVVGLDKKWITILETNALLPTWHIQAVSTVADARKILAKSYPSALLIDLDLTQTREEGLTFLSQLRQTQPNLPFFILDTSSDLSYRLEIARLGNSVFLQKPLTRDRLLNTVIPALSQPQDREATLMIVDDEPHILATLTTILSRWGFKVESLADPRHFWERLETVIPDLLILDVEMPHFNGLDLCRVVRTDDRFCSLPILFLSIHQDSQIRHQVFAKGGDDYLTKPIVEEELITRIFERLNRKLIF